MLTLGHLQRAGRWDPCVRVGRAEAWRSGRNRGGTFTSHLIQNGGDVQVDAWGDGAEAALEDAPALLGADDDVSSFRPAAGVVRDLHHRFPGLRIGRTGAVLESLVPTVFEQKVIGLEARNGYRRLVEALGESAPGPRPMRVPPAGQVLRATPYWAYHRFGLERRRADVVREVGGRARWLESCADLPPLEAQARLVLVPGVGPWSAAEVAMTALGDPDAVSVGDYHLPNLVAWALAGEARGSDEMMLELLQPYAGHRGRVLRLLAAGGISAPRRGPRLQFRRLERH